MPPVSARTLCPFCGKHCLTIRGLLRHYTQKLDCGTKRKHEFKKLTAKAHRSYNNQVKSPPAPNIPSGAQPPSPTSPHPEQPLSTTTTHPDIEFIDITEDETPDVTGAENHGSPRPGATGDMVDGFEEAPAASSPMREDSPHEEMVDGPGIDASPKDTFNGENIVSKGSTSHCIN